MAYKPFISDYKPFWIQTESDILAWDTADYGFIAKGNPFPIIAEPKEVYRIDWHDEDGGDEYCERMAYNPVEFEVEFFIKVYSDGTMGAPARLLHTQVREFTEKLRAGRFAAYDAYTEIGLKDLHFVSASTSEFRARDNWAVAVIKMKFSCDAPDARMVLSEGVIEERGDVILPPPFAFHISDYCPLYVQTDDDALALDTLSEWGMAVKSNPHEMIPQAKTPFNNSLAFENGGGFVVPKLRLDAMELSVGFVMWSVNTETLSGTERIVRQVMDFFGHIGQGQFRIFDTYTGRGYRNVRFNGISDPMFDAKNGTPKAEFMVKFRINDVITRMGMSGGSITEYAAYLIFNDKRLIFNGNYLIFNTFD